MLIDEILQQINNARSTQGKTPLTMDDLLGILSKDRASFERGGLTKNDENILLKLRDDEINSNPEKYASVASERAKREGVSNKTAGARNTREAVAGTSTNDKGQRKVIVTRGSADEILQRLIEDKLFGQPQTNMFCSSIITNATIEDVLETASDSIKATYLKMVADNTPKQPTPTATPTVLPASPAGGGRGFVNPESVTPAPSGSPSPSVAPSNAVMTASGPLMSGSGGYVTSGEPSTPSPVSTTGTGEGTMGAYKSRGVSPSAVPSGATASSYIQKASAMIVKEEGLPKGGKAYFDPPGQKQLVSIGYGHQIKDSEYKSGFIQAGNESIPISGERGIDTVMSKTQSQKLLEMDLPKYEQAAAAPLGEAWSKLNDEQKASLISYAYNTGGTASLVKRGLKDAIMAGDFSKAGNIISEKGIRTAGGVENATLVKRRQHEGTMFASTSIPSVSPSSPSTGVKVASASTSVSDGKMAAMTTTGGNTVVNAPVTNTLASNSGGGNNVSPYNSDMMKYLLGAIT
jgi:GH24 family phage-related lysozyme (muramidase)